MQKTIGSIFTKHKFSIILCVLFAFFYILPLLLTNVYYTDDMRRSITGLGWKYDGRHFASFMMSKLTGGGRISDFFPYSTILSAVVFALSGYIISLLLGLEKNSKLKFSALILLINPFLLENLSYRWDSLPMAVSVLVVLIPFLFIASNVRFLIASLIAICVTMFTYQASIVVYPLMFALLLIKACFEKDSLKEMLKPTVFFLLAFVLGLGIYKVMSLFLPVLSEGQRGSFVFFGGNLAHDFSSNAIGAWLLIKAGFSRFFLILVLLSALLAIWAYVRFLRSPKPILNKILLPLLVVPVLILIPSVLLFLRDSWPVARILIGFPFLIYLILLFIGNWSQMKVTVISILFIILSLPLMATYANALKSQNSLEISVAQQIAQTVDVNNKEIAFKGELAFSPETHVGLEKYPLLRHLVPSYMRDNWMWGGMIFNRATNYMHTPNFVQGEAYHKLIETSESLPKVAETYYYTLRADSTGIVVDFENSKIYNGQ